MSRPGYIKIANDIGASEEGLKLAEDIFLEAIGLFTLCICYCDRQLTDGHIPAPAISRAIAPGVDYSQALAGLLDVHLIEETSAGWVIPGYLKWQRSREQVEAASIAASNAAGSRWRNADRNAKGNASGNADRNAKGNAKELDRQIDTETPRAKPAPVDNSGKPRRSPREDPPSYDLVPLMGPITRFVGRARIPEALDDDSDLNHAIRRYLAAVDAYAMPDVAKPDEAKAKCRYQAIERLRGESVKNPAAYLTAAAGNATCLGDLVGDDFVTELRAKPKRRRKSEPQRIGEVLP